MTWSLVLKLDALLGLGLVLLAQATSWAVLGTIGGIVALVVVVATATAKHVQATARLTALERWQREHTDWGMQQLKAIAEREAVRGLELDKLMEMTRKQSLQLMRIETTLGCSANHEG